MPEQVNQVSQNHVVGNFTFNTYNENLYQQNDMRVQFTENSEITLDNAQPLYTKSIEEVVTRRSIGSFFDRISNIFQSFLMCFCATPPTTDLSYKNIESLDRSEVDLPSNMFDTKNDASMKTANYIDPSAAFNKATSNANGLAGLAAAGGVGYQVGASTGEVVNNIADGGDVLDAVSGFGEAAGEAAGEALDIAEVAGCFEWLSCSEIFGNLNF